MKATDLTETKVGEYKIAVGTEFTIIENELSRPAKVTRVTDKSIFILKNGETQDKMVVTSLFLNNIEKGIFVLAETDLAPAGEQATSEEKPKRTRAKKEDKEPKQPKEPKVKKLSRTVELIFWAAMGLSIKEIKEKFPEADKMHVNGTHYTALHDQPRTDRAIETYLHYNPQVAEMVAAYRAKQAQAGSEQPAENTEIPNPGPASDAAPIVKEAQGCIDPKAAKTQSDESEGF